MATMKLDPGIVSHLEWIGFVRPTGLVVSAPALVRAGAVLNRGDAEGQRLLRQVLQERTFSAAEGPVLHAPEFRAFASQVLAWSFSAKGYAGTSDSPIPPELELTLTDYSETLRPDYAVRELEPKEGAAPWQLLVRVLDAGEDFDRIARGSGSLEASAHSRMERLLRHTGVSAGLLFNGRVVRLVSAPRGESSGWLDFRINEMVQTAGRPISAAMRLLLRETRLLTGPRAQRLSALLEDSRKFQNEVSERLAEQVLHALYEMLRGFQAAHDASKGELLREPLAQRPDDIYRALLTVMLRLVFLLFAEERDMLPEEETFLRNYSLGGLYERLREDAVLYPDTMDQRYGAWAQLLVLFRMVFDGAEADGMHLPRRHGVLFDPDRFPFLEGRVPGDLPTGSQRASLPLVPDGTIYRALEKLLVLDGERISYRALDVEQIGSVYETMMGFRLETASGTSIAIKAQKRQGAPTTISLESLLDQPAGKREKWIQDHADRKLGAKVVQAVKAASRSEDLHAALLPVIDFAATPDLVARGAMVLQPSDERRRSGSHYTPRTLTEPIVRTTLRPILERMRGEITEAPRPEEILDLKVCDPAMGSGAFLVEACRQLAEALMEAWVVHGGRPPIPADEDEIVFARRLVAQRCLYGVDRNPVAVDLAKVSLWLVTLAKDHALTFLDHALRHGDSLVGLSRLQIENFHWDTSITYDSPFRARLREQVAHVSHLRRQIREAGESVSDDKRRELWDQAQAELDKVRLFGDLAIAAFFAAEKPKERERKRIEHINAIVRGETERFRSVLEVRRHADPPLAPFHWEIEFPEVFERARPGFDAFVGNPPFLGGTRISEVGGMAYFQWLVAAYPPCEHLCDLVAYFFRRAFDLLRSGGSLGLIATNTIAQGDTREGGLLTILKSGGQIFSATRRYKWPGQAAVVVSVVHISKSADVSPVVLDGLVVERINAYLFQGSHDGSPARLSQNPYFSAGSKIYGQGFLFDDNDPKCTPTSERDRLLSVHPDWVDRLPAYIGGEEVNSDPRHRPHRFVIFLSDVADEWGLDEWPDLRKIVEEKVKPERLLLGSNPNNVPLRRRWWAYQAHRPELYGTIAGLERVLVISSVGQHATFAFVPSRMVFSHALIVFPLCTYSAFCALQSRPHEIWARFFGSSMKDDLRYTPSDCFETFPLPENWEFHPALEAAGQSYYEVRAALMVRNDQGLTKTYNRFHDPEERAPAIQNLRALHAAMDRAVLDAYGWNDIPTHCEFLLDYEIDDEEWGDKKKPYRYRWPDDVRDEVLARLLELNAERARAEALAGAVSGSKRAGKRTAKPAAASPDLKDLFS
jgi:hypothetical protein